MIIPIKAYMRTYSGCMKCSTPGVDFLGGCSSHHGAIMFQYWLVVWTPLKNDGVKVSWDDDTPSMMGKSENSMVPVTTNQIIRLAMSNGSMIWGYLYDLPKPTQKPNPAHGRWAMGKPDSGQRSPGNRGPGTQGPGTCFASNFATKLRGFHPGLTMVK